jgi:hypothetical protein
VVFNVAAVVEEVVFVAATIEEVVVVVVFEVEVVAEAAAVVDSEVAEDVATDIKKKEIVFRFACYLPFFVWQF